MKNNLKTLLKAIMAGLMIGVGGTLFLSIENRYLGAFLFGIGLFTILVYKLFLFTGKVGYAVVEEPSYLIDLVIIWVGNFIGTFAVGQLMLCTRAAESLTAKAMTLCHTKLDDSLASIFVLSIFCGIMMFLAADNFSRAENSMQKNLGIFLPVMVFILCGFEHCVANMFYFTIANMWSAKAFLYLLVMTFGNSVGAFIFPLYRKI